MAFVTRKHGLILLTKCEMSVCSRKSLKAFKTIDVEDEEDFILGILNKNKL